VLFLSCAGTEVAEEEAEEWVAINRLGSALGFRNVTTNFIY